MIAAHTPEAFGEGERFLVLRPIGAGGMGIVYEVQDRQRGLRLALKTLRDLGPDALYSFKHEFRSLADLSHPNLVTLYELFATGNDWYFTMEYVEGAGFLEYVRPGANEARSAHPDMDSRAITVSKVGPLIAGAENRPLPPLPPSDAPRGPVRCDLAHLRRVLPQLGDGIAALHSAGSLHRDLKPSNVIVTPEGRVVILDFGLVTELHPEGAGPLTKLEVAGTADYMSPEQTRAEPLTAASDWYAVGVMLYQALTGLFPFNGASTLDRLMDKDSRDGGRPSALCDGVPEDLDTLCRDLLRRDPRARPSSDEILKRLGAADARPVLAREGPQAPVFVGRRSELAALRSAFEAAEAAPVAVHLRAGSGMGKTALLQRFLDELRQRPETVILSGRCYEQELVPFRALDTLIDSLGRHLRRLRGAEAAELLPRDAGVLAQMFPTLLRVPSIASAPVRRGPKLDPVEARRRAGDALRELLSRLGDRRRLVMAIDDLQWGDADSALLLSQVLAPPDPPQLFLLCAFRSEHEKASAFLQHLLRGETACRRIDLALEPFTPEEVRELSASLGGPQAGLSAESADRIARECGGNAFFVSEVLAAQPGAARGGIDELIRDRANRLPAHAQRLLEVVAVSARPLPLGLALQSVNVEEEGLAAYAALRNARLVRRTGTAEDEEIETYHDRVREAVVAALTPEALRERFRALAVALDASGSADPEFLAVCLEGSGEHERAGLCFARAAQRAADALAFDRAALLYERALRLSAVVGDERRRLLSALGEALANCGRSYEAAERFEEAARGAAGPTLVDLKKRAAYCYSTSGHVDKGREAFRGLLAPLGLRLPETPGQAVAALLSARLRLFMRGLRWRERPVSQVPTVLAEKADMAWTVAVGLGAVDPLTAASFSTRSLSLALRTGHAERIVRSLSWEASLAAVDNLPRSARLIQAAEPILKRVSTPYLEGLHTLARAIHAMNQTRFHVACDLFDTSEALWLENCIGVDWELSTARHFGYWCLAYSGQLAELGRRVRLRRREAEERGNLYVATSIGVYAEPLVLLAEDRPEEANTLRLESLARWTQKGYLAQHCLAALAGIGYYDYVGQSEEACRYSREQVAQMRRAWLTRMALVRITAGSFTLPATLSAAMTAKDAGPFVREAEDWVRRLARERLPWALAVAALGRAGLASMRGQTVEARAHLEKAAEQFAEGGMTAHRAAAHRQMGLLLGGDAGRSLMGEADTILRGCGVANPEKTARHWAPVRVSPP